MPQYESRAYPLRRPTEDKRFTMGLALDVAAVLEKHGYPPVRTGIDFLELQQALFRFLYAPADSKGATR